MSCSGKFGCPLCNGTGVVIGEFGLQEECQCVRELREGEKKVIGEPIKYVEAPNIFGEMTTDERIVRMNLVPKHRINDSFESDHVKIVTVQMCMKLKCTLSSKDDMERYLDLLTEILVGLRSRQLPKRSYIIGASNGFGKTTFANTAIKILATNGMKAVPYISLTELAEKWVDYTDKLKSRIENRNRGSQNKFETDDDGEELQVEYDWRDYVNSDLAIVYLTSTNEEVMWIETQCLKTLLELRDTKGKPTIVFTSESLDWYKNSESISKYMLSSILESQPDKSSLEKKEFGNKTELNTTIEDRYDKLEHISVYMKQIKQK